MDYTTSDENASRSRESDRRSDSHPKPPPPLPHRLISPFCCSQHYGNEVPEESNVDQVTVHCVSCHKHCVHSYGVVINIHSCNKQTCPIWKMCKKRMDYRNVTKD